MDHSRCVVFCESNPKPTSRVCNGKEESCFEIKEDVDLLLHVMEYQTNFYFISSRSANEPETMVILNVIVLITITVVCESTRCKTSKETVALGETATVTFYRNEDALDFTVMKYPLDDDNFRREDMLLIRNSSRDGQSSRKRLSSPYDDVSYFVMPGKIVLLFNAFKQKHAGRYVGTVTKEHSASSCSLNVSMALTKSTCQLSSDATVNCTFRDIPENQPSRSFLVTRRDNNRIEFYCDLDLVTNRHQCQSTVPGSTWQVVPSVEDKKVTLSTTFKLPQSPTPGIELFCEFADQPVHVQQTCLNNQRRGGTFSNATILILVVQLLALISFGILLWCLILFARKAKVLLPRAKVACAAVLFACLLIGHIICICIVALT